MMRKQRHCLIYVQWWWMRRSDMLQWGNVIKLRVVLSSREDLADSAMFLTIGVRNMD